MALPKRRQAFARQAAGRDLTYQQIADHLGITRNEVQNLAKGTRYPSPREIEGILDLFSGSLPIEVFFEPELLKYKDLDSWPPKGKGFRPSRSR